MKTPWDPVQAALGKQATKNNAYIVTIEEFQIEKLRTTYAWSVRFKADRQDYHVAHGAESRIEDVTFEVKKAIQQHQNSR